MPDTEVSVLIGPYRSGKSLALLDEVIRSSRVSFPTGNETLLVVPSRRYQRLVESRILEILRTEERSSNLGPSRKTGLIGLKILPFYDACRDALRKENIYPRIIPEGVRPAVVSRVLTALQKEDILDQLLPIADFAGTHGAILELIDEIERSGLSPVDVRSTLDSSASSDSKIVELAQVYERYWAELERIGYIDSRMVAFKCREILTRRKSCKPGSGVREERPLYGLLAVDGFDRFSKLQLHVLKALSRHCESTRILFDYVRPEDSDDRIEYEWKDSSYDDLIQTFGPSCLELSSDNSPSSPTAQRLAFSTLDRFMEMEEIARRIKTSLVDRSSDATEIAVVVPTLRNYKGAVEAAFEDAGLPYFLDEPVRIATLPLVHAIVKMLSLHKDDFPRRGLIEVLSSRTIDRASFMLEDNLVRALDEMSVEAGIIGGADRWIQVARKVGCEPQMKNLLAFLTPPPGKVALSQFVSWAEDVIEKSLASNDELQYEDPVLLSKEERALLELRNCFAALVQEDLILHGSDEGLRIDYELFLKKLEYAVERSNFRMSRKRRDSITICSVDLIDNRLFDEVHIAGLVEGEFPRKVRARGFVAPDEVARWASFGVDIFNPRMHPGFEQALFQSLLTRARSKVSVSFPLNEMSGEELLPSFFLTGDLASVEIQELDAFQNALSLPTSTRNLVSAEIWRDGALYGEDECTAELRDRLAESISMVQARDRGELQSPFNGYLVDAVQTGALAVRFPRRWSASRLNNYGKCPFRFWVSSVLGLEPFKEPESRLDPRTLGEAYHLVLERFYARVIKESIPVSNQTKEQLLPFFEEAMDLTLGELGRMPAASQSEFWEYERKELEFRLRRFFQSELDRADDEKDSFVPALVEASFGMEESGKPPLALSRGGKTIEFRGKIDRIDVSGISGDVASSLDRLGPGVTVRVVDYKAGSTAISRKEALEGRNLQLPIYALAVERSILKGARVAAGIYLSVSSSKSIGSLDFDGKPRRGEDEAIDLRSLTEDFVFGFLDRASSGEFTLSPSASSVCTSCDHKMVCRIAEVKTSPEEDDDYAAD